MPPASIQALVKTRNDVLFPCKLSAGKAAGNGCPHLWALKPKPHLLDDTAQRAQRASANPNRQWAFADGDFVGKT
eukprot:1919401-Alexandrium_andersonii.AAC.1